MDKPEILFLAHRIPFPPNKGDKIRSWRLLKHLLTRFDVHLGCFIDDPDDWQHVDELRSRCKTAHFVKLNPAYAKIRSAQGLLTGEPLSMPYYRDRQMQKWVRAIRKRPLAAEVAFSSSMAPYLKSAMTDRPRLVDFCDADSAKWSQYASSKSGMMGWVYAREGKRLKQAESDIIDWADASFAISESEASMLAPTGVDWFGNGVDLDFFDPAQQYESPTAPVDIVFVGAMDYWANIDAAQWFLDQCFVHIKEQRPQTTFGIVGSRPPMSLSNLDGHKGVRVTGRVDDVRPWLRDAKVVIAPMRIARGVQNKVLEAMAMEKAIVATSDAAEGIAVEKDQDILIANEPDGFSMSVLNLLDDAASRSALGQRARAKVLSSYSWPSQLQRFDDALDRLLGR